jgi:zinc protease
MLMFYLGTDPAKADQVRVELKDEIAKLASEGLTDAEIARAKKKLIGSEAIQNQSNRSMAQLVSINELFGLGAQHHLGRQAEIERVTAADVRRVAAKYLRPEYAVESVVAPSKTPKPN